LLVLFASYFWSSLPLLLPTLPLYIEGCGRNSSKLAGDGLFGRSAVAIPFPGWGALADRAAVIVLLIGMAVVAIAPLGWAVK